MTTALPLKDLQTLVLKLMRDTISDKEGNLPPPYSEMYDEFMVDEDNFPYLQTLAGLVSINPEVPNTLNYSANFGYTAEQVSIETRNLTKLALTAGWDIITNAGHYVTPDNKLLMGDEGYRAHRYFVEQDIIQQIRRAAETRREQQAKLQRPVEILAEDGMPISANQSGKIILPN